MKNIRTTILCVIVTLCSMASLAQDQKIPVNEPDYNKPKLFTSLPDKIPVSIEKINDLIATPVGRSSSFRLAETADFQFDGEVVSAASKYGNSIQSVVVRSAAFNGANFTISKIINADGTISYTGRIISFKHGDLYELQTQEGKLVLVKKNFYDLVNE